MYNVYHIFVIKTEYRNELQNYLNSKNIQTVIHYPRPIYDNIYLNKYKSSNVNVDKNCNQILSIPMYPFLTDDEIFYIVESINNFKL